MTRQVSLQQHAPSASLHFKLNGKPVSVRAPRAKTLLRLLREDFDLTGAKPGCEAGECGACTVLLDGKPVTSCMVLAAQAVGREVTTVEGLSSGRRVDPIIQELVAQGAVQCGYCIPGFVVAARGLLNENPHPTLGMIRLALSGNVCRCGGYSKIADAVAKVARKAR